ncbi:MAG: hypothetical protein KIT16_04225 [Rhodospirillaceae bacterium]|nr:hypothetical protein [Rhodospirillaceae bacterium]
MKHMTRRALLGTTAAAAAFPALPAWATAGLTPTPPQTEGPFYPQTFPVDVDADLVQVAGRSGRAKGTIVHLAGTLVNPAGRPIAAAEIEIWQCDSGGVYHHVGRHSRGADPNFQGYGKARTAADGAFRFRTIRPVAYPGRTPHIHVIVRAQGTPRLTTQLYIAGEPQNERDPVFRSIRDGAERESVSMRFRPAPEIEAGSLLAAPRLVVAV